MGNKPSDILAFSLIVSEAIQSHIESNNQNERNGIKIVEIKKKKEKRN